MKNRNTIDIVSTEEEPELTIANIKRGKFLGKGTYGSAYKLLDSMGNEMVYKIYHRNEGGAARSARYWNELYQIIYAGKYSHYAIARVMNISQVIKKKGVEKEVVKEVLITPFISGKSLYSGPRDWFRIREKNRFSREMRALGYMLLDYDTIGNIIIHREGDSKDPLPIDFDNFCPRPITYARFGGFFVKKFPNTIQERDVSPHTHIIWDAKYTVQHPTHIVYEYVSQRIRN